MTSIPATPSRRRFLQALGLGAAAIGSSGISFGSTPARAGGPTPPPTRVVFFITPHGTVWNQWKMPIAGPANVFGERSITSLGAGDWPEILAPLASYQNDLLVVEGLSRTTVQVEEFENTNVSMGNCNNRHHVAQAHLLTCVRAMQRSGSTSIGGGESIDQYLGRMTTGPGRWASRVYGFQHQHPYNFIAPGEGAPRVQDPRTAFNDILGLYVPPATGMPSRDELIRAGRGSVLDLVADEYNLVAPRLGRDDRLKLERHRDLLRDLELTFSGGPSGVSCDPTFMPTGDVSAQFARINALALSCDLTRVVTYVTQGVDSAGLGLPADTSIHQDYAHNSIEGSGGAVYTAEAERGMVAYNRHYANQLASFLRELDSTPDGSGESLLDHTAVVWLTELATGTHEIIDTPIVVAGGASGAFRTGRYVRYPMNNRIAQAYTGSGGAAIGPSTSQLYVSLMNAAGVMDDSFGMTEAPAIGGGTISLRGRLAELA
jgi:hypothetical protein